MNITRNNYETFFLLYTDNELCASDRKIVEGFVEDNPDLKAELELFQQYKLVPDENMVFENKADLFKSEPSENTITILNYEEYFVLYADNELNNTEKAALESFVYHHPQFQSDFELIQQLKFNPEPRIVFPNKEILYRKEKDDKVIPFVWWRWAAAALVLLALGLFWLNNSSWQTGKPAVVAGHTSNGPKIPAQKEAQSKFGEVAGATNFARHPMIDPNTVKKQPGTRTQQKHPITISTGTEQAVRENFKKPENAIPVTGITVPTTSINLINEVATNKPLSSSKNIVILKEANIDQPAIYLHPDENNDTHASFAYLKEDQMEVMNTTVNKKNSLRGLFRKASRILSKPTARSDENNNRKGILIGGFEIAVK